MNRITLPRAMRLAIGAILVLMLLTSGVLLVLAAGKAVLPLILIALAGLIVLALVRGPIVIRERPKKE